VVAEPGTEVIELFPQWVLRPWNVFWEHGTAQIIGVPIPAEHASADPDEPPDRLVNLARALGDERRLRILRRLTTGSYSLQDLADHFGIPKTTLLHHLVILRSAGIVRVGPGPLGKYSLRPEMPLELHRLLDGYLPPVPPRDGGR
jgi:DNA-binding transcriptional ArsR family regulator